MDKKVINITFEKLKKDMVIAKDVEQNGNILLKKDVKITEQMIKKLQGLFFIGTVQIYDYEKQNSELTLEEKN